MTSNRDNTIFEKTSFLQGVNSPFIKELYLQYLENPGAVPQSWKEFFDGLDENKEAVQKEILGPSWAPKKNNYLKISTVKKDIAENVLPNLKQEYDLALTSPPYYNLELYSDETTQSHHYGS